MSQHKMKAQKIAAKLWERYYHNDNHITCVEVKALTGKKVSSLYWAFQTHGVQAPPVWDTKAAIRERHIRTLWRKYDEVDRDWLSVAEAAEVLGKPQKEIYSLRCRYSGYIPEIRNITTRKLNNRRDKENREAQSPSSQGKIDSRYHSRGLLVMAHWPGPGDNETTYLLR